MTYSVDWADVILPLLRNGLGETFTVQKTQTSVSDRLPLVVCRRTGGSSFAPRFWDQPYVSIQNWSGPRDGKDAGRAAHDDADEIRRVLWQAWEQQLVVPAGHLVWVRESQSALEENDPAEPDLGRFVATYEFRIRRART